MKKEVCIGLLVGGIFLASFLSAQDSPDWLRSIQLFQMFKGYFIQPCPILSSVPFTGQGWGVYFPNDLYEYTFLQEIASWHQNNRPYLSMGATTILYYDSAIGVPNSHRMRDLEGHEVEYMGCKRYTPASLAWRNFVKQANRRAIDLGVDGIQFDEGQVTPLLMCDWNAQPATFDSVTMVDFRDYLASKYTQTELLARFGISDITAFRFDEYIRSHGLQESWNKEPFTGLGAEFFQYLIAETRDYFRELRDDAKTYAWEKYRRAIVFSSNPCFAPEGYMLVDIMDYFIAEDFPFDPRDPFSYTDIKAIKGMRDWPVFVIPEPKEPGLPLQTKNMMRFLLADIYGAGGEMAFGEKLSEGILHTGANAIEVDFETFGRYARFILGHRALYEGLTPIASVALVNGHASRLSRYWPIQGGGNIDFGFSFTGAGLLLGDSDIPFDCVFAPDARFCDLPKLTVDRLKAYSVVILPRVFEIDDGQAQIFLDYMAQGGTLVAFGAVATHSPDGTRAHRSEWEALQQSEGEKRFGQGRFVYEPVDLGEAYLLGGELTPEQALTRFQTLISSYVNPEYWIANDSGVYTRGGVMAFPYRNAQGHTMLHLVNYDYDPFQDRFVEKENLEIGVRMDTSRTWEAVYFSPDESAPVHLALSSDPRGVCVHLPRLEAYGILVFQENASPPVIHARTPGSDTILVGGETLLFSVTASDPDGNPLHYAWSVDGLPMEAQGPSMRFETTHANQGERIVTVTVTDGKHAVEVQWQVTIQPYRFPKILVDEAHGERNTMNPDRALLLNPEHPDWVLMRRLKEKMEKDFLVSLHLQGSIQPALLDSVNVLMICSPDSVFRPEEIQTVEAFVRQGGSLLWIGDVGLPDCVNDLLSRFGLTFDPIVLCAPGGVSPAFVDARTFPEHPAFPVPAAFSMSWAGSFSRVPSDAAIAWSDSTTWRDLDWDLVHDEVEPRGPFPVVVAFLYGKGWIVALSDNSFNDGVLSWEGSPNDDLLLSALAWLTQGVNRVSPVFNPERSIPKVLTLAPLYPNPFNGEVTLQIAMPVPARITLRVYDVRGRLVRQLVDAKWSEGIHFLRWDGRDDGGLEVSSGLYLFVLSGPDIRLARKGILLR